MLARIVGIPGVVSLLSAGVLAAAPVSQAADATVQVSGRINYIIDGQLKAPYGSFKPSWPAPRFSALRLDDGRVVRSSLAERADGAFRLALRPGAYVITRIGFGTITDDTYIAWPGVILCVPEGAAEAYAGHLQLLGETNALLHTVDGRPYRSRAMQYTLHVVDERAPLPDAPLPPPLMRVDRDFPLGDRLVEQVRRNPAVLIRQACGPGHSGAVQDVGGKMPT